MILGLLYVLTGLSIWTGLSIADETVKDPLIVALFGLLWPFMVIAAIAYRIASS